VRTIESSERGSTVPGPTPHYPPEFKREAVALYRSSGKSIPKMAEELTKDTPAWYASTRAKVEARAALEQAEELRRVLEELGERLG
jgi:transposase-like protein